MSFGRVKTRLLALINRKDLTAALAGDFIVDAIAVLERDLRIGPMETLLTKSDWDGILNVYPVPANYLEGITLFTDAGALHQVDMDTFLTSDLTGIVPLIYSRVADRWLIKPTPAVGAYVYLHYYGETVRPVDDEDDTVWTEAGFLALLYKAAELAADFYQMETDTIALYRGKAQEHADAIAGQTISEQMSGRITIGAPKGVGDY